MIFFFSSFLAYLDWLGYKLDNGLVMSIKILILMLPREMKKKNSTSLKKGRERKVSEQSPL
jgi:hypothetical protein